MRNSDMADPQSACSMSALAVLSYRRMRRRSGRKCIEMAKWFESARGGTESAREGTESAREGTESAREGTEFAR